MKIRQALFTSAALSVLAALAATPANALDLTSVDAAAANAIANDTMAGPVTPNLTSANASSVSITGIVSGQPESVSFSGQAQIQSRLVRDPDFNKPSLLLTIDLSTVSGVGASTKAAYVIPSQENVQRPLAASHRVEITFPFLRSNSKDPTSARSGVASFALDFDVNTGAVTKAAGSVATPAF
jgi:hypothetical protein